VTGEGGVGAGEMGDRTAQTRGDGPEISRPSSIRPAAITAARGNFPLPADGVLVLSTFIVQRHGRGRARKCQCRRAHCVSS